MSRQSGRSRSKSTWPDECNLALGECLRIGLSGAQAASVLSEHFAREFTRNAVLGQIFRIGRINLMDMAEAASARGESPVMPAFNPAKKPKQKIDQKPKQPRPERRPRSETNKDMAVLMRLKVAGIASTPKPPKPRREMQSAPDSNPVNIIGLRNQHCRWPIGDPVHDFDGFRYCGAIREDELRPYCPFHNIAAIPSAAEKRERRIVAQGQMAKKKKRGRYS